MGPCNFENARKTKEVECCSARFKYETVGGDEEGRFTCEQGESIDRKVVFEMYLRRYASISHPSITLRTLHLTIFSISSQTCFLTFLKPYL